MADELLNQGFKYVSVLPQGYLDCHDLALRNKLDLVDHDGRKKGSGNCYFCSSNRKKILKSNEKGKSREGADEISLGNSSRYFAEEERK